MNISKEEKKIEAIARMKLLGIYSPTVEQFEKENLLSESRPPFGACFWVEGEQLERIHKFEKENNALVYLLFIAIQILAKWKAICLLVIISKSGTWIKKI